MDIKNKLFCGDSSEVLKTLPDESVDCCVTSPPYWGLRDYGVAGQIGLEDDFQDYVGRLVSIFREVHRVLKKDGTLWLNLGDSYAGNCSRVNSGRCGLGDDREGVYKKGGNGLKDKDLVGIPWRVALALQMDGWYLRQDIIWHKPNPMPESVTDRCTKSHEYIFLLSKSPKYFFDQESILETATKSTMDRLNQDNYENQIGSDRVPGKTNGNMKACKPRKFGKKEQEGTFRQDVGRDFIDNGLRNKRSVWTVGVNSYKDAHFATFPPELIRPCILAGCPRGGVVLDPFMGSGTTADVARDLLRFYVGIEINPEYIKLINKRLRQMTIMDFGERR